MKLLDQSAKTNWKFIAIVAVAVLLFGGGAWWYGKMLNEADLAQEQEYVRDLVREDEQESETAGWQTYRNEEYGFEVKYPANFTVTSTKLKYIQEPYGDGSFSYPAASPFDKVSFSDQKNKSILSISVISYPSEMDISKESYTKGYFNNNDIFGPCEDRTGFEPSSIEEMKILGHPIVIVRGTYTFPEFELGKTLMCAYLKNKANNILVMDSEDFSLLNEILSTFRFVEN